MNIKFFDSEQSYFSALVVANYENGTASERAYKFQDGEYVPLWINALKELFGVTSSSGKVKTAKDKLSSVWFEQTFQDGKDNAHVIFTKIQTLDSNGNIDDCHACSAAIGAITYKLIDNQWQIVSKQPKFVDSIGNWGDVPEIKQAEILQLSPNNPALLISESGIHMGITYEWTDLFTYYKNNWRNLGGIVTGYEDCSHSNEKGDECRSGYKGKISIVIGNKSDHPDLLVTRTGTEADIKGNIVPAKNAIYVFNGKEYVEKKGVKIPATKNENLSSNQKAVVQDNPVANSSIMQMINYAQDNGGVGHETEIQQAKLEIETSSKPPKGNRKEAHRINDLGLALLKIKTLMVL